MKSTRSVHHICGSLSRDVLINVYNCHACVAHPCRCVQDRVVGHMSSPRPDASDTNVPSLHTQLLRCTCPSACVSNQISTQASPMLPTHPIPPFLRFTLLTVSVYTFSPRFYFNSFLPQLFTCAISPTNGPAFVLWSHLFQQKHTVIHALSFPTPPPYELQGTAAPV